MALGAICHLPVPFVPSDPSEPSTRPQSLLPVTPINSHYPPMGSPAPLSPPSWSLLTTNAVARQRFGAPSLRDVTSVPSIMAVPDAPKGSKKYRETLEGSREGSSSPPPHNPPTAPPLSLIPSADAIHDGDERPRAAAASVRCPPASPGVPRYPPQAQFFSPTSPL